MRVGVDEQCPLPVDPLLAEAAVALTEAGHGAWILDADWRVVFVTDEYRLSAGGFGRLAPVVVGVSAFGAELLDVAKEWRFGPNSTEILADTFADLGGLMLADLDGDRDRLRSMVDESMHSVIDELTPDRSTVRSWSKPTAGLGGRTYSIRQTLLRLRDADGMFRGSVHLSKPGPGISVLSTMALQSDASHMERMQTMMAADRRPAAILFADLERSSLLARRLSTASYFALTRRIVQTTDQAIIDTGGLVGRHVGDGVVGFFPAVSFASESRASRACIDAARRVRDGMHAVAERSELDAAEVVMRFGLHWGSTLYIGGITTGARSEVTAMGEEANEAARIEASATGGRILASKPLIERLDRTDAAALGIDLGHISYRQLADLDTATDKARRDAPAIAVCEL